jgi:calcineurin-like phosphoesterase family protein
MLKLNTRKHDIWFTSDTHYWHKNLTYGESRWENKETNCRRFDTTREMSLHVVSQINKYVKKDDILFHLGDWSFGGKNNIWNFRKQLNCKTIHLILGNHDSNIKKNRILELIEDGQVVANIEAQKLFASVQDYLEVSIDGIVYYLFHRPIEEWDDRTIKSYHLFGHVHGQFPHGNGRIDVGMDYAYKLFNEYRPFNSKELIKFLKE